jgi:hypothetical protein
VSGFSVGSMGSTPNIRHQCPSAVKMKLEWEAEEKAKAARMAVNHVMKYQNAGQFRALPPPYHHQYFQPSPPAHAFHPP